MVISGMIILSSFRRFVRNSFWSVGLRLISVEFTFMDSGRMFFFVVNFKLLDGG